MASEIENFASMTPSPENYFRCVVLFGRNVASYKFALAKSLVGFAQDGRDVVPLTDLAEPFALELCTHLRDAPRQTTSRSSAFLEACQRFNAGGMTQDDLVATTTKLGFVNVIDAFHNVGPGEIPLRFFNDERRGSTPSIAITDALRNLVAESSFNIVAETESRWRLVEHSWKHGMPTGLIGFDDGSGQLVSPLRRQAITGAREALNGYQKGVCFYCYRPIGITPNSTDLADVDHVFPHVLQRRGALTNLDGVWNLVLACTICNRGPRGKFDATPATVYVERLHTRNEYLIASHDPLRQTLMSQTGLTKQVRQQFLQGALDIARVTQVATWSTNPTGDAVF